MRKRPQQQRAKRIVDDILDATLRCISRHGVQHTTTPKIAEISGVSVGSIYQYFENKEQIIAELLLRKSEKLGLAFKALVIEEQHKSIQEVIRSSIEFGFESLKADQGFLIEILKNWHQYTETKPAQILEKHFYEVGIYVFNRFYSHWSFETLKHKSFVIINSTLFTMMRFVSHNQFMIEEARLKTELFSMLLAYLDQPDTE